MEIETAPLQAASVRGETAEERRVCLSAERKASWAKRVTKAKEAQAAARDKKAKAARDKGLAESKPKPSQEEGKENDDRGESPEERMARLSAEIKASWVKRVAEAKAAREARDKQGVPEAKPISYEDKEDKYLAAEASEFRDTWNSLYSRYDGDFEETTKIPNKRFTYKKLAPSDSDRADRAGTPTPKIPNKRFTHKKLALPDSNRADRAGTPTTLQIFSIKVSRIRGGLQWPLHVFGMVAIRDCIDHKRNIIFNRPRDNCQIITKEVPYLKLIGPTRAVLLLDPATFEVDLKVKGTTEAEDDCLSFLAATYINSSQLKSEHFTRAYPCRLSTLEFELGSMIYSVEATIDVRIISGSWPDCFRAQFAASTASITGAQVILLDSGNDKVHFEGYGKKITLSRCVASVEIRGELRISVKALQGDKVVANKSKVFKPRVDGASDGVLRLGFCTLGFTLSWSLISPLPLPLPLT